MPNSAWYDCTNTCLLQADLDPFLSAADFDGTSGNMVPKYQMGMKYRVQLADKYLALRAYRHFNEREITLVTVPGQASYPLDVGISGDDIKYRSFFNRTQTIGLTSQNRELRNMPYNTWERLVPDVTTITNGPPMWWILQPIDRTAAYPIWNVTLYPTPDQAYTIKYQARLDRQTLALSSDLIIFPSHYEHAIWTLAEGLLEVGLGEGKEGALIQMAQQAAKEVWLASNEPDDIRRAPKTMHLGPRLPGNFGWYNSPASIDSNGNVID